MLPGKTGLSREKEILPKGRSRGEISGEKEGDLINKSPDDEKSATCAIILKSSNSYLVFLLDKEGKLKKNKVFFVLFRDPEGSFCPGEQAIDQDSAADDDHRGHCFP